MSLVAASLKLGFSVLCMGLCRVESIRMERVQGSGLGA